MTQIDKGVEKAFEFAQQATKELIGLGTGVLAITITFLDDIVGDADGGTVGALQSAWVLYLVSVVAGVATLQMLAGNLEKPNDGESPSIYANNIGLASKIQVGAFVLALILTIWFGFSVT